MASKKNRVITDDEIERDIAELKEAAGAWHNDREKLHSEAALCSGIRKKYKGNPAAKEKLYARLPEKARFSKLATIGDIEEFKKPEIWASLPDTLTGRYAAAQLYKAKLWTKALAAGVIHRDATEAALKAYRRVHGETKSRKRTMRLSFSGFDAVKNSGIVKVLLNLRDQQGLELFLNGVKQPSRTAEKTSDAAAGHTKAAA